MENKIPQNPPFETSNLENNSEISRATNNGEKSTEEITNQAPFIRLSDDGEILIRSTLSNGRKVYLDIRRFVEDCISEVSSFQSHIEALEKESEK